MTPTDRHASWLKWVATALVVVAFDGATRSQERSRTGVFDRLNPAADDAQDAFERSPSLARRDPNQASRKQRLESLLRSRVDSLAKAYQLSDAQTKKLLVAGQGDIKRYIDSLEETWANLEVAADNLQNTRELRMELVRLERVYKSGMFKNGSIFAKTLEKTLSGEQTARYKKDIQERRQHQFRTTLGWVVGTLEQTLKMTGDQRRRLEKILIDETRAPESFGTYDYYGIIFQAAAIPEAKLRPIFDDDQWQVLQQQFKQVRAMEQMLKNGGFIPLDDPASATSESNTNPDIP